MVWKMLIVEAEDGRAFYRYGPLMAREGTVRRLESEIDYYKSVLGPKIKTRIIENESEEAFYWDNREREKFNSGEYFAVPWADHNLGLPASFYDRWSNLYDWLFPHISTDDPSMIAYTASFEKGMQDVQTKARPGRFLQKYFGDVLKPDQVRGLAGMLTGQLPMFELKFAVTADEIVRVYTSGPSSCMSKPADYYHYTNGLHPVSVYAGVFQVAYLERFGRISDRALVWPEKKLYGRVYGGNDGVFIRKLKETGFSEGHFNGARLPIIKVPGSQSRILMPYVDWCGNGRLVDGMIELSDTPADVMLNETSGYIESRTCSHCQTVGFQALRNVNIPDDRQHRSFRTEQWCSNCRTGRVFECFESGYYWVNEDRVENHSSRNVSYTYMVRNGWSRSLACEVTWPIRQIDDLDIGLEDIEAVARRRRPRPGRTAEPNDQSMMYYTGANTTRTFSPELNEALSRAFQLASERLINPPAIASDDDTLF